MENIYIYKYIFSFWDSIEEKVRKSKGYIGAFNYSDAIKRVELITAIPDTDRSELIDVYLKEVDSFNGKGVLTESVIKEENQKEGDTLC